MKETISQISGKIVDVKKRKVYPGTIVITDGKISRIIGEHTNCSTYLIPGFIDSHVHVESSMLTPTEFARAAVIHGTVGSVCDPHEIANVMGIDGIRYMITDGDSVPFKYFWGASSCVPATSFETAGARIDADQVQALLKMDKVKCLSEMMNFPGVLGFSRAEKHRITKRRMS